MGAQLKTAVIGATGYAGCELVRLLAGHPRLARPLLLARDGEDATRALEDVFPQLSGNGSYPLENFSWGRLHRAGVDLLFLATPHEVSRKFVPEAIARGLRVIDLSGAWRLKQPANAAVYGLEDEEPQLASRLVEASVYGLPELISSRLPDAQLVANPGCYATSVILALAPLVHAGIADLEHGIVCDSKSGVSGAGKKPTAATHFVEVADNLSAYAVFAHRHTGEILEQLGLAPEQIVFTPHLLPIPRGILSTVYVRLKREMVSDEIGACFHDFYRDRAWVRLFQQPTLPQIRFSVHTNFCDLGFSLGPDGRRLILVSCLDNLLKGAAGQAVQNMNLMYDWGEREGLS